MKFLRLALLTAAIVSVAASAATPGTPPAKTTAPSETREEALTRENRQLAAELARTQDSVREAQAALAKQSAEIATVRAESAAGRIQLNKVQSELASARSSLASQGPDLGGALERERTAHLATKATLAERESQVQDLITSRDKIESENRVLQASAAAAKSLPPAESPTTLAQNAELNAKVATLTRELASARSEVATLRQELRNQTNKAATDAETHSRQVAALQETLTLARNELSQTKTSLDATARSSAALELELSATRSQLGQTKSSLEAANQSAAASHASTTETETQLAQLRADTAALQRDLAAATTAAQKQSVTCEAEIARLQGMLARSNPTASVPAAELETAQRNAADAQRQLNVAREEIEALRAQIATTQDLEIRVRELEAEKADRATRPREPADRDELDRAIAARASAEDKLATVLRAYTLLARERDELRAQVAALSTKQGEPPARPASTPIPVTFAEKSVTPTILEPAPQPASVRPTPALGTAASAVSPSVVSYQPTPPVPPRPAFQATRPVVPPGQPAFSHRITVGETLASISRRYYGNPARWTEIVAANRDVLPDQRSFAAGKMLRIP